MKCIYLTRPLRGDWLHRGPGVGMLWSPNKSTETIRLDDGGGRHRAVEHRLGSLRGPLHLAPNGPQPWAVGGPCSDPRQRTFRRNQSVCKLSTWSGASGRHSGMAGTEWSSIRTLRHSHEKTVSGRVIAGSYHSGANHAQGA
jgi:hypothetical protein